MDIFAELTRELRKRQFDQYTVHTYLYWVRRFLFYHGCCNPKSLKHHHFQRFMDHLQDKENASLATRQQAKQAISFLFENLLDTQTHTKTPTSHRLSRQDVQQLLNHLDGAYWLMAAIIYGSGLRAQECICLRINDLHMEEGFILIPNPNSNGARKVVLDKNLIPSIRVHLGKVRSQHIHDLSQGDGYARLPQRGLDKNTPYSKEWPWQFLFPSSLPQAMAGKTSHHRFHLPEQALEQQLFIASKAANLIEPANCLSLRRSFASHLAEKGYSLAAIQQQLGHEHPNQAFLFEDQWDNALVSPFSETMGLHENEIKEPCALYQVA